VSVFSGGVESTDSTLVLMGFDPDRAQLITALIVAAIAAAAVGLLSDRTDFATMLGTYSLVALFGQTFVIETQNALASTGAVGSFDLGGWVLTLITLLVIGLLVSWAGATLAIAVRPGLLASALAVRDIAKARRPSRRLARRPLAALLVAALLVVTVPAFGDMVNVSPDVLMFNGEHGPGLVPGNSIPEISPIAQASATPSPTPGASSSSSGAMVSPSPSPTPVTTAAPGTRPWLAWKPSGTGSVHVISMAAPWVGGSKSTSDISVYTPPGYDPAGTRRYPVLYEAPTGLPLWGKGTNVIGALDILIDSGDVPASIVAFIDSSGGPYGDTQCADSYDGRQWFESYISTTAVNYVDQHYLTISDPRARGIMGMSAGGFCAAMLALRHPDIFSISISFSGYYWAGAAGTSSALPFGGAAGLKSHSPALLAAEIPGADRSKLYFVVIADAAQQFYGPQAAAFEKILKADGYKYLAVNSPDTHGWPQVRYETPGALRAWAARLVINGIW
jgi:enterochelin esterase-like enzyme